MNKPTCVIYGPVPSYSGYGAASRDRCKAIIELYKDEWDIKIIPCGWGNLPTTFIEDHEEWQWLNEYIITNNLNYQPDIMLWMTIPPETKPIGKWNCLFTAGIETTICAPQWIEHINQLDLTIVPSEHSKEVFRTSSFNKQDTNTKQIVGTIKLEKPIEVLFEGFNEDVYKQCTSKDKTINETLNSIPETFLYLFNGMWLKGDFGEDRKNVGGLIKIFLETFKNKRKKPALLLKTSSGPTSLLDREKILNKIDKIRQSIDSKNLPNIYLIQGDLQDKQINDLYNHPKVKAMVSLTKGEGFGRPLLEFTQTKKPIICSGWGGQIDFLKSDFTCLVPGKLTPIHKSAQVKDMLIEGSQWFSFDPNHASAYLVDVFEKYNKYKENGSRLAYHCKTNFSYEKMKEKMKKILDDNVKLPYQIKMPKLSKIK